MDLKDLLDYKEEKLSKKLTAKGTSKETWKAMERQVAKDFCTDRTPLSGMVKTITNSDTLHPKLYIECKLRAKEFAFWDKFEKFCDSQPYLTNIMRVKDGEDTIDFMYSEIFFKLATGERTHQHKAFFSGDKYTSLVSLYCQTKERARIEEKIPVVALKKKNKKGYLIGICPSSIDDVFKILNCKENG